jgi:hypothetical protein
MSISNVYDKNGARKLGVHELEGGEGCQGYFDERVKGAQMKPTELLLALIRFTILDKAFPPLFRVVDILMMRGK